MSTYAKAKGLIDSYRLNNEFVHKYEQAYLLYQETNNKVHDEQAQVRKQSLILYSKLLKQAHMEVKIEVQILLRSLRKTRCTNKEKYLTRLLYHENCTNPKGSKEMPAERNEPRISINKLGEYLVATPARRLRIIKDQKNPRNFIVTRYQEATEAIISFLEDGARNDTIIETAIDVLLQKSNLTEFQEQDRDCSIEALESLLDIADEINLDGFQCKRGELEQPRLTIAGVSISVRPEIIITGTNRTGDITIGLLKVYLAKSHPHTEQAGSYIGTVLHQFAMHYLGEKGTVNYRHCQTLDVFRKKNTHRSTLISPTPE